MKPITPEPREDAKAVVFAKDQPEYIPLPANVRAPYVETKWKLTWRERLKVLRRGEFYLTVMTFSSPLQPLRPTVDRDDHMDGSRFIQRFSLDAWVRSLKRMDLLKFGAVAVLTAIVAGALYGLR